MGVGGVGEQQLVRVVNRRDLLAGVSRALGDRELVWFGTRGDDVESIADLPELTAVFSIISAYALRSRIRSGSLEQLSGIRVDLDAFEIDDLPHDPPVDRLRDLLLRALAPRTAVATYRPSRFLSAVAFARRGSCRYLGMFKDHAAAFEHKPWVETAVADLGIPHIPWTYVADSEQLTTLRFFDRGPVMLRRSRTSGGVGLTRVEDPGELARCWPAEDEAYVSVAPFIEAATPINVGAVVWRDGITIHPASLQLIGVSELTRRPFGYCGNDFGAFRQLDGVQVRDIEDAVLKVGTWLGERGYRGAFGVDFLIDEHGRPLFTEVNPRFQGSTHASAEISVQAGESCVLLEHLGALLGLPSPPSRTLTDWADTAGNLAHFVVHSLLAAPTEADTADLVRFLVRQGDVRRVDVIAPDGLLIEPDATTMRVTVDGRVTTTGFELSARFAKLLARDAGRLAMRGCAG